MTTTPAGPVPDAQITDWIDIGLDAVLAAAPIAREHFRVGVAVEDKRLRGVYDPVTVADREVEVAIRAHLGTHLPGHRIVGEEHPEAPGDPRFTWFVDPIDGTRAYITGMPLWGTLLGLVVDGVAVAGIMHQPFTGETFVADPVRGARMLHAGDERPLRTRHLPGGLAEAVLYSTHPSMFDARAARAYESIADQVQLQRWGGDCYAYAMLAAGHVDLVIESGLRPYDIVALIPIVEQAGGVVTDLAGNAPVDGGGAWVVASGDPRVHAEVLAQLRDEVRR